jgi:hypothetical protein
VSINLRVREDHVVRLDVDAVPDIGVDRLAGGGLEHHGRVRRLDRLILVGRDVGADDVRLVHRRIEGVRGLDHRRERGDLILPPLRRAQRRLVAQTFARDVVESDLGLGPQRPRGVQRLDGLLQRLLLRGRPVPAAEREDEPLRLGALFLPIEHQRTIEVRGALLDGALERGATVEDAVVVRVDGALAHDARAAGAVGGEVLSGHVGDLRVDPDGPRRVFLHAAGAALSSAAGARVRAADAHVCAARACAAGTRARAALRDSAGSTVAARSGLAGR